jgi:hypothetical protein
LADAHAPLLQTWPLVHAVPHAPQLVSELSCVSQPLLGMLSQLSKPVLHAPIAHAPLVQAAVALAKEQATLQAPQLVVVLMARSQPLAGDPSQSSNPALHAVMSHPVIVQVAIATLASVAQLLPQLPQLAGVLMFTSQPLVGVMSQSRNPAPHVNEQLPLLQPAPVVFGLPVQSLAQVPQLAGSDRFVSQLVLSLLQSSCVDAHVSTKQMPVAQVGVALAIEQVVPHVPQDVSVRVLASHPSEASPLQFANPVLHVI